VIEEEVATEEEVEVIEEAVEDARVSTIAKMARY